MYKIAIICQWFFSALLLVDMLTLAAFAFRYIWFAIETVPAERAWVAFMAGFGFLIVALMCSEVARNYKPKSNSR